MSASEVVTDGLWDLLAHERGLRIVWRTQKTEESRKALNLCWGIWITSPGSRFGDDRLPAAGDWKQCTATVLSRDHYPAPDHLEYRGACLGCGWVSDHTHRGAKAENLAVEDAHDHTHPGWRDIPVVGAPPSGDAPSAHNKLVGVWVEKWAPLLPDGWLERGGPIRTRRERHATRHVPGRAPGGGYDLAADDTVREEDGGQLCLL